MEFSKPIKLNNDCIYSSINEPVNINSQEELDKVQDEIVEIIVNKSTEWFNKIFSREDILKKLSKKEYSDKTKNLLIKGIHFFKNKFELEIESVDNQNFFEDPVVQVQEQEQEPVVQEQEPIQIKEQEQVQEQEPVQEQVQEQEQEPEKELNEDDKILQKLLCEEKTEHTEHTEQTEHAEQEYTIGQTVEVLVGNLWSKAKILLFEDDSYTVMFSNGKKMTGIMSEDIREIRKISYNKTIKRIKDEIVDAYENKDLEKAYKLSKILKQLI